LKWSHNEEWAVLGGDYGFADYLHIQNDQITIIDGSSCTLDTGEVWYVSVTFSDLPFNGPNSNGKALIRTHGADPNSVTGYTCIVDLNTLKGILISIPDPLGAVFSPDNKIVLLINREGVAQYNLESKQIVWLNKDLTYLSQTDRPNISSSLLTEAIISNTAQYAVIGESVDSKLYEWVYKIPQLQGTIGTSTPGVPNINGSQPTPTGGSAPGGNQVGG